jgi:hypothetical protein
MMQPCRSSHREPACTHRRHQMISQAKNRHLEPWIRGHVLVQKAWIVHVPGPDLPLASQPPSHLRITEAELFPRQPGFPG